MNSREYYIITSLLAAGTVLRFVLVLFNEPLTPNILVAFYGLAIMAVGLSFGQSLALGFIAGCIMALISHSLFNPAFLVSEPVGAAVCLGVFLSLTPSEWRAGISVFVATLVSGIVFAVLVLAAGQFTIPGPGFPASFISPFVLLIIATAAINSIIAGMLFPRIRNFRNRGS